MKRPPNAWSHTFLLLILSGVLGLTAGVAGTALTSNYLSDYALSLGEVTHNVIRSQTRPQNLPQTYQDALNRVKTQALPAVGSLYASVNIPQYGVASSDFSTSVVSLTSDGWVLSSEGALGDTVRFVSQTCEVDNVIVEPRFGWRFLHCPLSNAAVIDIGVGYDVKPGDQLFVVTGDGGLAFVTADAVVWGDVLRSSDTPSRRILLTQQESFQTGSPVLNVSGELVGLIEDSVEGTHVILFEHLSGAFEQLLEFDGSITYPSLGVRGIDLSRSVGVSAELSAGRHVGFLLYGSRAVAWESAAHAVGLEAGDLLLSIDGVTINGTYAIDDILAWYTAGEQIQLEFERDGVRQEVTVTLGELEN